MFNPKIFIPLALVTITGVVGWFTVLTSEIALFERFPEIDQKVVIKAHRIFVRRTLTGKYNNVNLTDEKCDELFLGIVKEITSK